MDTDEQWVNIDDVSTPLKVNKETIRRWIKELCFPFHRAGNLLPFQALRSRPLGSQGQQSG